MSLWPDGWREILDAAPEGIAVCDAVVASQPVLYVNRAFMEMCGYPAEALLGANLRMLQGSDSDQQALHELRESVKRGEPGRALLRNYRSDGALFWNEMLIQPVRDESGQLVQWVSYHRDVTERLPADRTPTGTFAPLGQPEALGISSGLPAWMREDRLTGLHSRTFFEELLRRDWQIAQRDSHEIGLTLFDIDDLGAYNETFDKAGGDACIRRVARAIGGAYRRRSDLVGRWEGGTFAVLTQGEAAERASEYAKLVIQRVRDLLIHNPRAPNGSRYVTLSAGVASLVPVRDQPIETLVCACLSALKRAKAVGKNQFCAAEARDFKE
ncbi:MAG TPA: diguanylate cyclase [Steroidobacteraceae bacterium]|jgi:diguanylate cyclase (GGDEF)-like protein/PAS domain S-box-containing protein